MSNNVKFEGYERRIAGIEKCLAEYGIPGLEEARDLPDVMAKYRINDLKEIIGGVK